MSLMDELNQDLKEAMKAKDKLRTETIRSLKSAFKYAELETEGAFGDEEQLAVVMKQAKQRRDAISEFEKAGRDDLIEKEAAELKIMEKYLPQQLDEAEIKARVQAIIDEVGVTDMKGLGQVMGPAMAAMKGQADGKVVNKIVRELLSGS